MQEFWDTPEAKDFFIEERKQRGLSQGELAKISQLSPSAVSNVENIKKQVIRRTAEKYCDGLGINLKDVPNLMLIKIPKKEKDPTLKLVAIETLIDSGHLYTAKQELNKINLSSRLHSANAHLCYLRGRYYGERRGWKRASNALYQSMQIVKEHPALHNTNLQAACYYELARYAAWQNDLKQSIEHVSSGLSCFCDKDEAERKDIEFALLVSQVIYSRQLGLEGEAKQTLHKMWRRKNEINTEVKLNMAVEQAQLYNKEKMYDDSIECLHAYIPLARKEEKYDRLMELWAILGVTYKQLGDLEQAKICLQTAEKLESQVKNKAFTGHTYIELGQLYLQEGDVKQAKRTIQKGMKLCKKSAVKYLYGLHSLAECYEQEEPREAIRLYEEAIKITEQHNLDRHQSKIFMRLAVLCEGINSVKYKHYLDAFFRASIQADIEQGGVQKLSKVHTNIVGDPPKP